jgi:hypothetical protein
MTLAAVDRLVHHSTIFEMNVESYRRRVAAARAPRKPRASATARATATVSATARSREPCHETSASLFRAIAFQKRANRRVR